MAPSSSSTLDHVDGAVKTMTLMLTEVTKLDDRFDLGSISSPEVQGTR